VIDKIIAGGHTGPERAALDAAIKYGVPHHAGWIHYIRSEERDKLLDTYNLKVIPALDPRAAIRQNITHANGTLILAARKIIDAAVTISLAKPVHAPPRPVSADTGHEGNISWPVTIPEAVNRLVSDLFLRDKSRISAMVPIVSICRHSRA